MSACDGLTGTSNQVSQLDRRVVVRNPPDDGLDGFLCLVRLHQMTHAC
jgi:hypothetical protein